MSSSSAADPTCPDVSYVRLLPSVATTCGVSHWKKKRCRLATAIILRVGLQPFLVVSLVEPSRIKSARPRLVHSPMNCEFEDVYRVPLAEICNVLVVVLPPAAAVTTPIRPGDADSTDVAPSGVCGRVGLKVIYRSHMHAANADMSVAHKGGGSYRSLCMIFASPHHRIVFQHHLQARVETELLQELRVAAVLDGDGDDGVGGAPAVEGTPANRFSVTPTTAAPLAADAALPSLNSPLSSRSAAIMGDRQRISLDEFHRRFCIHRELAGRGPPDKDGSASSLAPPPGDGHVTLVFHTGPSLEQTFRPKKRVAMLDVNTEGQRCLTFFSKSFGRKVRKESLPVLEMILVKPDADNDTDFVLHMWTHGHRSKWFFRVACGSDRNRWLRWFDRELSVGESERDTILLASDNADGEDNGSLALQSECVGTGSGSFDPLLVDAADTQEVFSPVAPFFEPTSPGVGDTHEAEVVRDKVNAADCTVKAEVTAIDSGRSDPIGLEINPPAHHVLWRGDALVENALTGNSVLTSVVFVSDCPCPAMCDAITIPWAVVRKWMSVRHSRTGADGVMITVDWSGDTAYDSKTVCHRETLAGTDGLISVFPLSITELSKLVVCCQLQTDEL